MIEPDQIMPELKLEFRILDVSDFCARQKKLNLLFTTIRQTVLTFSMCHKRPLELDFHLQNV